MNHEQRHIIQRQVLEVDCRGSEREGREWQRQMSRFARENLGPVLQELFDRYAPPGLVLRLDRLEIAAGIPLNGGQWEAVLAQEIARQISEQLASKGGHDTEPDARQLTPAQSVMEQFFYFLKTGRLSWQAGVFQRQSSAASREFFLKNDSPPAAAPQPADLETALTEVLKKQNLTAWRPAFLELIKSENVRRRLREQFRGEALALLVGHFFPENATEIVENQKLVINLATTLKFDKTKLEAIFWEIVFENIVEAKLGNANAAQALLSKTAEPNLAHLTLLRFFNENPQQAVKIINVRKEAAETWLLSFIEAPHFKKMMAKWGGKKENAGETPVSQKSPAAELEISSAEIPQSKNHERPDSQEKISAIEDSMYVDNAGMVLLHPFLPAFFEGLGIVKKGRIVKPGRAVHLLQFLATGQSASPEYLLPLNKLLCGLPLDLPVEAVIRLTKKEKTEAKALLEAVIKHWAALKNTSPEGLQGAFLCRAGALSQKPDGDWLLRVEQKTFDVLHERLPWSFSIVKLPWMERLLWVEWG